jgi:hypothetical protein
MQTINKPGNSDQRIFEDNIVYEKHPGSPFEVGEAEITMIDTPVNNHDSVNDKHSPLQIIHAGFGLEENKSSDLSLIIEAKDNDTMDRSKKLPPLIHQNLQNDGSTLQETTKSKLLVFTNEEEVEEK